MNNGKEGAASADRQVLIVWTDDAEAAAPLEEALRGRFVVETQDSLSALGARLAETSVARALLLYMSPVDILCRAMIEDTPPSAALVAWQARALEILDLNRQDRRRVQLLEIDRARANPVAFREHFQLPDTALPALPPQDEILALMALRVLEGNLQSRRIQAELEAASLAVADGPTVSVEKDSDLAFQAYRKARQETELLQAQIHAAQEELENKVRDGRQTQNEANLFRAQLRLMKQEMDTLTADRQNLEQRLVQMSQGMESYEAQLSGMSAERDRLLHRLGEKERSLVAAGFALQELEEQNALMAARQGDAVRKEAELRHIMGSKSYRLTAPLRRLRSLVPGRGKA